MRILDLELASDPIEWKSFARLFQTTTFYE